MKQRCQSHRYGGGHRIGYLTLLPFIVVRQSEPTTDGLCPNLRQNLPSAHQLSGFQKVQKRTQLH